MILPRMTMGNWLYWGILAFFGINFFWLGFMEMYLPQWVGAVLGVAAFLALLIWGPRPLPEKDED